MVCEKNFDGHLSSIVYININKRLIIICFVSRGLSRVEAGNPGFPRLVQVTSGGFSIRTHKSGGEGFGYDPIFEPEDTGLTFAEMGPAQKNAISHRSRAIQKLAHFLLGTETSDSSHEKEN